MSVDSLRLGGRTCPNDCNGNGVCNSMGHCHCADGFAPPFCDYPGPGGSEDSGPASDPNGEYPYELIDISTEKNSFTFIVLKNRRLFFLLEECPPCTGSVKIFTY